MEEQHQQAAYPEDMGTLAGTTGRVIFAALFILLGLGHLFFAVANFGFVERLPQNLDVLIEALTALIAAGSLPWAAVNLVRRKPSVHIILIGGCAFLGGLLVSIAGGASTPGMLQVVIPIFAAGLIAVVFDRGLRRPRTGVGDRRTP